MCVCLWGEVAAALRVVVAVGAAIPNAVAAVCIHTYTNIYIYKFVCVCVFESGISIACGSYGGCRNISWYSLYVGVYVYI